MANGNSGARLIDAVVNTELLPEISGAFLRQLMEGKSFSAVQIDAKPDENRFVYRFAHRSAMTWRSEAPLRDARRTC